MAAAAVRDHLLPPRPLINLDSGPAHTFDAAPRPVDQVIADMLNTGWMSRVSRADALSVAAVQRGRNEICAVATLPLRLFRGLEQSDSPLFRQIDIDVPNVVTLSATIEDLIFEGIAWWRVTSQDFDQFPMSATHVDVGKVSLRPPGGRADPSLTPAGYALPGEKSSGDWVWVDGEPVSSKLMIRFDSPNPGLLKVNAIAIRRALALGRLASMYGSNPRPLDYFTDSDNPDVEAMQDHEIDAFLAEWAAMRRLNPTAWIPSTVKRVDVDAPSPAELQLTELTTAVTLEIANGIGVDPEDLGVSTTSRSYFNGVDRRQEKINRVYAPYMKALTDRLVMGDITRRGYEPRFDLTDYLKSDPTTQVTYWKGLYDMGAVDSAWVRAAAGIPGSPPADTAPAPAAPAAGSAAALEAHLMLSRRRFDDDRPMFTFHGSEFAGSVPAPEVDTESRTITGLALPYNAVARKYGIKIRFLPGSLEYGDLGRMKHLMDHEVPVGVHTSVTDTPAGPMVKLSVLGGVEGSPARLQRDQLMYDAENGLYDGLSVGVEFDMDPAAGDVVWNEEDKILDVVRATWRETSSTPLPAFDDARVTKVAAAWNGENPMDPCPHCTQRHVPGIACATFAARLPAPAAPAAPAAPTLPAMDPAAFEQFMAAWRTTPAAPAAEVPAAVNPHRGPAVVTEPAPYRFDRYGNLRAAAHDFSSDLFNGWRQGSAGDAAARDRANAFLAGAFSDESHGFAVTPANVASLNPARNRADMYVDQLDYPSPLWDAINKGTLDDITPFTIPKFSSSSGVVADHVSGVEPTPGAFAAGVQTITPTPVSGKLEVLREAWDQGGNPQMSGLIWRQMTRGYSEALEAYAVAQIAALAASITDLTITTAAVDGALDAAISAALVPLQYVRGGDRFRTVFTQIDLYKAMVAAKDTTGRRLYPELGPVNANGTVDRGYSAINAHGKIWLPAWALAATGVVAASSYMFDPEKVCGWATAPRQIDIEFQVRQVEVGIWGYKAFGITDFNGTREVVYDPI